MNARAFSMPISWDYLKFFIELRRGALRIRWQADGIYELRSKPNEHLTATFPEFGSIMCLLALKWRSFGIKRKPIKHASERKKWENPNAEQIQWQISNGGKLNRVDYRNRRPYDWMRCTNTLHLILSHFITIIFHRRQSSSWKHIELLTFDWIPLWFIPFTCLVAYYDESLHCVIAVVGVSGSEASVGVRCWRRVRSISSVCSKVSWACADRRYLWLCAVYAATRAHRRKIQTFASSVNRLVYWPRTLADEQRDWERRQECERYD